MYKVFIYVLLAVLMILAACSNTDNRNSHEPDTIDVDAQAPKVKQIKNSQQDGLELYFLSPDHVIVDEETPLITHIALNKKNYSGLSVKYKIKYEDKDKQTDWQKAIEISPGEYEDNHTFDKAGDYTLKIHIENNKDLNEYMERTLTVHK